MKIAFDVHAWQPHVQLVKHNAVGQVYRAKEFRFGKLKEANVRAVKNDARRIDVTPAHAFLNRIFFVHHFVKQTVSLRRLAGLDAKYTLTELRSSWLSCNAGCNARPQTNSLLYDAR
jgi:hypothetical protein